MAVLPFPSGDNSAPRSLTPDQVANVAADIATHLGSIERLSSLLSVCSDVKDRGALGHGIECLSRRAAAMADLLGTAHGGAPVRGDFNAWCASDCMPLLDPE